MKHETIERYLEDKLGVTLKKLGVPNKGIQNIKENIRENMYSIIFHWNDIDFRKAILIVGMEEATFYEPEADIDTKCFVVATIRNSYLEHIFSVDFEKAGLSKELNEQNVKIITGEAIEYFKNVNFNDISKEINLSSEDDKFMNIVNKYPIAWNALIQLGKCTGKRCVYEKKKVDKKLEIENIGQDNKKLESELLLEETESGISEEFSTELNQLLKSIIEEDDSGLYADCFKMLTRNFEKLLKTIEILLENESYFLTSNYMITDSYIAKRTNIYRASHTISDYRKKLQDSAFYNDIPKAYKTKLKRHAEMYLKSIKME